MTRSLLATLAFASLLTGCDMLGIDSPEKIAAAKEADGKAVGAACRQAGRAIEDCYTLNRKADKAAVFAGWRDMNDYMRENKIAEVVPLLSPPGAALKVAEAKPVEADDGAASRPSGKPKPKAARESKEAKASTESTDAGS